MTRITLPRQVGLIAASARKTRGLTQAELAQLAGVSRQLVNRLEAGTATGIALDKLLHILNAAGCTLDVSPIGADASSVPDSTQTGPTVLLPDYLNVVNALDESLFDPANGGA